MLKNFKSKNQHPKSSKKKKIKDFSSILLQVAHNLFALFPQYESTMVIISISRVKCSVGASHTLVVIRRMRSICRSLMSAMTKTKNKDIKVHLYLLIAFI